MVWLFVAHFGWSWWPCVSYNPSLSETFAEKCHDVGLDCGGRSMAALSTAIRHRARRFFQLDEQLHCGPGHPRHDRGYQLGYVPFRSRTLTQSPADLGTGTFVIFGVLITIGAGFIWFYVPETKRLTLEEKDIVFGSSGVAQADRERMAAINAEIGLDRLIGGGSRGSGSDTGVNHEKVGAYR